MVEFFNKLVNEYFSIFITCLIAFVLVILVIIILFIISSKRKNIGEYKNLETDGNELTDEEISNISKNSANPEEIKNILNEENKKLHNTTKKGSKNKKNTTNKKQPKIAKEVKPEEPKNNKTTQPESDTTAKIDEIKPKKKYLGKWKIKKLNGMFFAELTASNGGVLLRTEFYTTLSGVKNGIETIKKNVEFGNFKISTDKYGHFQFKLYSSVNRVICVSEDYSSKTKCENAIESVKRFASTANLVIDDSVN